MKQSEVDRRLEEHAKRTAAMQAQAEATRVANDLEQLSKIKATEEVKAATVGQLRAHRRPQQGEPVEYQVFREGHQPVQDANGRGSARDSHIRLKTEWYAVRDALC